MNQGRFSTAGLSSKAVDQLLSGYLIRTEEARGGRWIELSHDRFIDPILESNCEWLSQGQSPLAQPAKAWFDHKNDDSYLLRGQRLIEVQKVYQSKMESLSTHEREFLTASINAQLKQTRRMYSLVFFLLLGLIAFGVLWIRAERKAEQARIAGLLAEVEAEKARVAIENERRKGEEATRALDALYSFLPQAQAANIATDDAVFQQFLEAKKRLKLLINPSETRRDAITIQYFSRDSDPEKIVASLWALGFGVRTNSSNLDEVPTNAIWFSRDVAIEDVRVVGLTLQRAGIQIKQIQPFRDTTRKMLIQVGGKKALSDQPNLTIDQVSNYSIQ